MASLTIPVQEGWVGALTKRVYHHGTDTKESAEAQERQYAQTVDLQMPKNVKPGSPEYIKYEIQREALSNYETAQLKDVVLSFQLFRASHPEYLPSAMNDARLQEYFRLKGYKFVQFNGEDVPLATTFNEWEEAYRAKLAMGDIQIDAEVWNAEQHRKAVEEARAANRRELTNEEMAELSPEDFQKLGRELGYY